MRGIKRRKKIKIKETIYNFIKENMKIYLILIIIFFIGLLLGVIHINNVNDIQSNEIIKYINDFINSIKENYKISTKNLLMYSLYNNIIMTILLCMLGSMVIGVPLIYIIIGYKGYCIGYTISSIIATIGIKKGIFFVISTMLLQNIISIPAIISLAVSGIKLYKLIIKDKRKENIKIQILKHIFFCIIILIILILSSFVETYISGNLSQIVLKKI